MSALEMRRATPDDDEAVRVLLHRIFPENSKCDPDVMRWQYWNNPYGPAVSLVWTDYGKVVCHYAGVQIPIVVHGKPRRAMIGVDAATDPAYRGQGLFTRLAGEHIRLCVEEGYRVLFYFPAPGSALPSIADTPNLPMPLLALPLDGKWLARRLGVPSAVGYIAAKTLARAPRRLGATEVDTLPEGLDDLWARMGLSFSIVKDASWWQWRYAARPKQTYRYFEDRDSNGLTGAAVTTTADIDGPVVYILELLGVDPGAAGALVRAIVNAHPDVAAIGFRCTEHSPQTELLRAAGLRAAPLRVDARRPSLATFDAPDPTERRLHQLPWAWSWGDLDHL